MKLIVFGSTGGTGREVVKQALEQGHHVTAFARNPERINQKHEKLHVIKGNVLDFASIERAIQGQDVVLCTLGSPPMDKSNLRAVNDHPNRATDDRRNRATSNSQKMASDGLFKSVFFISFLS